MKRGAIALFAFVSMACSAAPHGNIAQYEALRAQHDQLVDELNQCTAEPGCYESTRYKYTLDAMAQVSIQESVASPYKGY